MEVREAFPRRVSRHNRWEKQLGLAGPRSTNSEDGFTLIELLVVFVMVGIVFTLSALALHWYWLVRSLQGAQDQVTTQMRQAQQRSVAESYPNVYGLRFQPSSSKWAVVKGNLSTGTCAVDKSFTFDAGVQTVTPQSSQDFITDTTLTSPCRLAAPNGNALDQVVFFYPKGTTNSATGGSLVIVTSPPLNNRQKTVTVLPLTGKVTRSP